MSIGKTKSIFLIKHGIAPYLKSLSEADIKKPVCYVISFDESLNRKTQMCKMDVIFVIETVVVNKQKFAAGEVNF